MLVIHWSLGFVAHPPHPLALHPTIAYFQIKDFIWSGFIKGPGVCDIYLVAWCPYIPTESSGKGWTSIYPSHKYNMKGESGRLL